jgi:hypothetical protein
MRPKARVKRAVQGGAAAVLATAGWLAFGPAAAAGPCLPAPPEVLAYTFATQSGGDQQDNFEDGLLQRHWSLKHISAHSYAYSDTIHKEGGHAILLTVHHGDQQAEGAEDDRCSERAELMEPNYAVPPIGPDLWYGFALYLPADLPPIDRRLILAQIKQPSTGVVPPSDPSASRGYRSGNPVVALRLREIRSATGDDLLCFSITPGNDGETHKQHIAIVELKRDQAVGRWHNVVLHAKIVPGDAKKSRLDWWFDDRPVPRVASAAHDIAIGYIQAQPTSYFKIGPYRDQADPAHGEIEADWTFGIDAFKRHLGGTDSFAAVSPNPNGGGPGHHSGTADCEKALTARNE